MRNRRLALVLAAIVFGHEAAADDANKQGEPSPSAPPALEVGKPIALFDGKTLNGWTTEDGKPVAGGWKVENGELFREGRGGNIFYEQEVGDFELTFEWKIAAGGNNGLKYRVRKYGGRSLGCEYQILGETKPSFSKGSCGSLYVLYEPNEKKKLNPPGEWNRGKIIAHGPKIEQWMNGEKIVEADLASEEWRKRLSQSKFRPYKDFARNTLGRIMITEHGSQVWYRNLELTPLENIEIPPLSPPPTPKVVVSLTDMVQRLKPLYEQWAREVQPAGDAEK